MRDSAIPRNGHPAVHQHVKIDVSSESDLANIAFVQACNTWHILRDSANVELDIEGGAVSSISRNGTLSWRIPLAE